MPIRKVKSKRFAKGRGYRVEIDRVDAPRIRRTFATMTEAKQVHDAYCGDIVRKKYDLPLESFVTLGELVDRHLQQMKRRGRDKTNTKRAETILTRLKGLLGAARLIETIKTSDLQSYVDSRYDAEDPPKPQTINRELNEIKSCLSAAATYYATLSEYRSPRAPWQEEPTAGRRETWDAQVTEAILRALYAPRYKHEKRAHVEGRRAVGDMFYVARRTGLRAGEVRQLHKSQVDFNAGVIRVTSRKGISRNRPATTREVPMPDDVRDILKRRCDSGDSQWVFPGTDKSRPLATHLPTFIKACERAGIAYGLDTPGGLIFNDARRTAENEMLEAGHHAREVGDILGHSAETMAKHYARSTSLTRRAAVNSTKSFGGILAEDSERDEQKRQDEQAEKGRKATASD